MPFFIAALLGGLIQIAASMVGRVMIALGVSVVTYTGIDASLTWLKAQAVANFTALPPEAFSLLAYLKVGVAINIIFSAMLARMLLNGLQSGTFKRWVVS